MIVNELLEERREVRRLLGLLASARVRADGPAIDAIDREIFELAIKPFDFTPYERPNPFGVGAILHGVLTGYTELALFDAPELIFQRLARAVVNVGTWPPGLRQRILDLAAPLDVVLSKEIAA